MSKDTLGELAERCEQVTGPDRELDIAIALMLPNWTYGGKLGQFYNAGPYYDGAPYRIGFKADDGTSVVPGNGPDMLVPHFTASLDAAMTLVPEGVRRIINIAEDDITTTIVDGTQGCAGTPALALCAAALRARAAQPPSGASHA